jgi:hypothetical protein
MEKFDQIALVLCLTFLVIFAINAGIILWARRKDPIIEVQAFRLLVNAARNPMAQSKKDIEELSRLVAEFKQIPDNPSGEEEEEGLGR